jgi:hypothetical protein
LQRRTLFLSLTNAIFLAVWLTACQTVMETSPEELISQQVPTNEGSPTRAPQSTGNPTEIAPDPIQSGWEASAHANSYVLDELGMNSTCARCHAPVNYIPSMEDMPDSCATCKFEIEPPAPLIAEADWEGISCNICHQVKKGEVDPEYAWLAIPPIDEYEDMATTTELCMKCHTVEDVAGHTGFELAGAHLANTCTDCHDAHSTAATCSSEVCHADVINPSTPIPGHDEDHMMVACWTCHDASGLVVGPDDEENWITFEASTLKPFVSHNIVKEAPCEHCHFLNNPWNLPADISTANP